MLPRGEYVDPRRVATWFINHADRDAGEAITPLKLQKLVYYGQAWFLANFDRPLFTEDIQAWAHGPVCPPIFHKYKGNGWEALPSERNMLLPKDIGSFLRAVFDEYGQFSAKKLERMTHQEDPWKETRGNLPPEARCEKVIPKILMRNYYAKRLGKKEKSKL